MIKNDERYMAVVVLKNILHEEELESVSTAFWFNRNALRSTLIAPSTGRCPE